MCPLRTQLAFVTRPDALLLPRLLASGSAGKSVPLAGILRSWLAQTNTQQGERSLRSDMLQYCMEGCACSL